MPELGDFGVVRTGGWAGALIRWGTQSPVNHAFIYLGNDLVMEAEPNGATVSRATKYADVIWSTGKVGLTQGQRLTIVNRAKSLVGTPYNWLDIVAIALAQRRLGGILGLKSWIAKRLSDDGMMICSQLVDWCYQQAGVQLFKDGRPSGMVSPGDLYGLIHG